MTFLYRTMAIVLSLTLLHIPESALAETAPWGTAKSINIEYKGQKVVYDAAVNSVSALVSILDRASYLSTLNGADPFDTKIVILLHGNEIPFFAIKNYAKHKDLMIRAQSLSVGDIIEFRMCKIAARGHGFEPADIHGFVTMVPMGDAEIIRLQQQGYAYMR